MSLPNLQVLDYLFEKGVRFSLPETEPYPPVTRQDIEEFLTDRDAAIARLRGVSKQDYLDWKECDGKLQCPAITKKGKPCEAILERGLECSLEEWVERRGEYCAVHSGEASGVRGVTARVR